ncbi:MAG: ATP-dependent DNA helicase [Candidatus Omnitrophica bacterium]|nr:ATP-dependent DNA helicase [Candidatus Omnitrophota bacterium]
MNIFSLVFGNDYENLPKKFRNFEARAQQIEMVKAVQNSLLSRRHLLVEAGTGVGKSLAYLLPLIKWTNECGKKVVISTYTKTLQRQLVEKDLPELKAILGLDFSFALCVGSQNYLCLRRLNQNSQHGLFESEAEKKELVRILRWSKSSKTGLRPSFNRVIAETMWSKICRESDLCLGKKCLFRKECFYAKARFEEYKANILITNHHLFFSHIASGGNVLPRFDAVTFDEAHTLEDVATSYLGTSISNFQIKHFCDSLFNPESGKGFLRGIKGAPKKKVELVREKLDEVRNTSLLFFSSLKSRFGILSGTIRIREKGLITNYLDEPLSNLAFSLKELLFFARNDEDKIEIEAFISRAQLFNVTLDTILCMRQKEYVYWIEILNRSRGVKYTFFAAPIDIADEFKTKILDDIRPVILTSATISVGGSFEFIKKNLGMGKNSDSLILDSSFDYRKNALLYLSDNLPDPSLEYDLYEQKAIGEIKKIIYFMHGRTFVLFTSFKMMDRAYATLKKELGGMRILRQGDVGRYQLLQNFKRAPNAVLLGTATFWQGIDVPGRALECVILSKLPFSVPDEPVAEAKMERLVSENRNPFTHYQMPRAVIMFRQGFGRLIRTEKDKGMVAVIDPRIKTRAYGKTFLSALPECKKITNLNDAKKFFEMIKTSL